MNFNEFVVHWLPLGIVSLTIYLYMQQWLCHPQQESGLHWRGMILKFTCWPVFFRGFILSVINKEIPYIPTAKKAMKGFTVFVRPLIVHVFLFIITLIIVLINRGFFTPEARITLTSADVWGMMIFATIPFLLSLGGLYAAWQSGKITIEEPWQKVNVQAFKNKSR